jgi:hypothetical protein
MHETLEQEVKLRMAEHRIDQETDFTVQRESRKNVKQRLMKRLGDRGPEGLRMTVEKIG